MDKPVLPLAVGPLPDALPRSLSTRHITPYSPSSREAAFSLAGALGNLPPVQPAPSPLPQAPLAPLSYLTDLVDHVNQSEPLTLDHQREILVRLEPALDSADPEEARGARYVLETFSKRDDLYADIGQSLAKLGISAASPATPVAPPQPVAAAARSRGFSKGLLGLAAVGLIAAAGVIGFLVTRDGGAEKAVSLTGRWSGRAEGNQTVDLVADITDGPPLTAKVSYPSIPCECTWEQTGFAPGGVRYVRETPVSGDCAVAEITLVPNDNGTLSFSSTYYVASEEQNWHIEGTLTRTGN
jgi:hypothetical protein